MVDFTSYVPGPGDVDLLSLGDTFGLLPNVCFAPEPTLLGGLYAPGPGVFAAMFN